MFLRRYAPLVICVAALACAKTVSQEAPPSSVTIAQLDPTTNLVPTPNDLVLQAASSVPGAQGQLLQSFVRNGGWPNDQEVPIQIPIVTLLRNSSTGVYAPGTLFAAWSTRSFGVGTRFVVGSSWAMVTELGGAS